MVCTANTSAGSALRGAGGRGEGAGEAATPTVQ